MSRDFIGWEEQTRTVAGMLVLLGIMAAFAGYGWYNRTTEKVVEGGEKTSSARIILGLPDSDCSVRFIISAPVNEPVTPLCYDGEERYHEFYGRGTAQVTWKPRWKEVWRHGKVIKRIPLEAKLVSAN